MTRSDLEGIVSSVKDQILEAEMQGFDKTFKDHEPVNGSLSYDDALEFLRISMEISLRSNAYMTQKILEAVLEFSD